MIVMCFNSNSSVVEQASVVLKSIDANSYGIPVIAYLINFEDNPLEHFYNLASFRHLSLNNPSIDLIAAYSSFAMYDVLCEFKKPLLWLDVDVIVRKNVLNVFTDVKSNTLKLVVRENASERYVFNTGVVAVGYSESTLKLLKWWKDKATTDCTHWCTDQKFLYRSYNKHRDSIDLVNMGFEWNDLGGRPDSFSSDSYIWHCKSSHFKESSYQREYKIYRR